MELLQLSIAHTRAAIPLKPALNTDTVHGQLMEPPAPASAILVAILKPTQQIWVTMKRQAMSLPASALKKTAPLQTKLTQ
jgi:hypothetical protein